MSNEASRKASLALASNKTLIQESLENISIELASSKYYCIEIFNSKRDIESTCVICKKQQLIENNVSLRKISRHCKSRAAKKKYLIQFEANLNSKNTIKKRRFTFYNKYFT